MKFQELLYHTETQKKKFLERVCSADFTVDHVSKTVLIYLDTRQKKEL